MSSRPPFYLTWDILPALRLLLPFSMGIVAATYTPQFWINAHLPLSYKALSLLSIATLFLVFWANYRPLAHSLRYATGVGIISTLLLFAFGYANTVAHTDLLQPDHFGHIVTDSSYVLLRLEEPPIEREKSYKATASVLQVRNDTGWVACSGTAMLYFEPDSMVAQLHYGDVILSNAPLRRVQPPPNPNEFDYAYYLQQQNIWHQAYLGGIFWQPIGKNQANWFRATVFKMRDYCLRTVRDNIGTDQNGGVAAALLIGYTHLLEDDVRQIYSQTGVTHVLAVSGMHVGILAGMLGILLAFLKKRGTWGITAHTILLIVAIWTFSLVTGATPSVMRAAIMFTLLLGSLLYGRKAINYNIIAASAFIILLLDPKTLFHVGFQLSYAAVLGIIMFQQPLQNLWTPIYKINRFWWDIVSVTLAAQVLTFPLTLYYFHQFPIYFVLANLFAVPLSSFILNGGVLLLPLALLGSWITPLNFLAIYWGKFLWGLIWLLNKGLALMGNLPFFSIKGIAPTKFEVLLMFGVIGFIIAFLFGKKTQNLKIALTIALIALLFNTYQAYCQWQQRGFHVYSLKNGLGMAFIDGRNSVYIGDSVGIELDVQQYHIQPYRDINGITANEQLPLSLLASTTYTRQTLNKHLYLSGSFAQFYDKTLLICDTTIAQLQAHSDLNVDYLLLTQNPRLHLQELSECVHFKYVIMDASNSRWRIRQWEKECEKMNMPYHNVKEQGAYLLNW
jgi:competence protein ComEC